MDSEFGRLTEVSGMALKREGNYLRDTHGNHIPFIVNKYCPPGRIYLFSQNSKEQEENRILRGPNGGSQFIIVCGPWHDLVWERTWKAMLNNEQDKAKKHLYYLVYKAHQELGLLY